MKNSHYSLNMNQMLVKFHSASVFILDIDVLHY